MRGDKKMAIVFECPFHEECEKCKEPTSFYDDEITYTLEAPHCVAPFLVDRQGNYLCRFELDYTAGRLDDYKAMRDAVRLYRPPLMDRIRSYFKR